jgi:large subunit ribosomal protein L9
MEIILLQDQDELGLEGDIVRVANGYARNYLIPRGIAFEATPQNIRSVEQRRKKIELRKLRAKEEAEALKKKMSEVLIQLSQKAGEEGKLYGSVTSMDIAGELENQGIVVDRRKILLDKPIKTVGEYDVPVRIYPEVVGSIRVAVSAKEDAE